jgi:hypothetical protein
MEFLRCQFHRIGSISGGMIATVGSYAHKNQLKFSLRDFRVTALCVATFGLLVHGLQASQLGLYWDDTEFLMLGMHMSPGNMLHFVFHDMPGLLTRERPLQYFPWMLARGSFAVSLPTLHWFLAILVVLNALAVMYIAQRLLNQDWFALAAGLLFLTLPLSPLQAIWPTIIHYLFASLLALLSMLFSLEGLEAPSKKRSGYFICAALASVGSLLMHEAFALFPLAFLLTHMFLTEHNAGRDSMSQRFRSHLPLLGFLLAALLGYALWREIIQPTYGIKDYDSPPLAVSSTMLLKVADKMLQSAQAIAFPWYDLLKQLSTFLPSFGYIAFACVSSFAVWMIAYRLLSPPHVHRRA